MEDEVVTWLCLIPDYWPPTLNQVLHAGHWRVSKERQLAFKQLEFAMIHHSLIPRFRAVPKPKVTIWRLWGKSCRAMDKDNLYGSVKPLLDSLCPATSTWKNQHRTGNRAGLGIIPGDRECDIDLVVEQMRHEDFYLVNQDYQPHMDQRAVSTTSTLILVDGVME